MPSHDCVLAALLERHGRTYADEAGIRLTDEPAPLYQLLVLTSLLSARITADIAVSAAREVFAAGWRTPQRMLAASWQDRVDALGRGHYRRYDERTATMLGESAQQVTDDWHGDLRRLHAQAGDDPGQLRDALTAFTGIGPVGAGIFLREAQAVWPEVPLQVDDRVAAAATQLGLPHTAHGLSGLAEAGPDRALLGAALVRVALEHGGVETVLEAAS